MLGVLLVATSCGAPSGARMGVSPGEGDSPPVPQHDSSASVSRDLGGQAGHIAYVTGEHSIRLVPEDGRVRIKASERSPDDGLHYSWDAEVVTTVDVVSIGARHANEFYVYGLAPNGASVIERWELQPWTNGAHYTERTASTEPIGVPVRAAQTQARYRGPFIEPALRAKPVVDRIPLVMPNVPGTVVEVDIDPEARFLVFRSVNSAGESTLVQYEFLSGQTTILGTKATHPLLAEATNMRFVDSTEEGRMLSVETGGLLNAFLIDKESDGVFESSIELGYGEEIFRALPAFTLTWYH